MASNNSSANDDGNENMLYEVVPLLTCPHLGTVKQFSRFEVDINQECPNCTTEEAKRKKENWICLTCHTVIFSF
uniref:Uncharacterized protein n=1 Tax=Panagrolaimus sp. PS1159 TaxID=55785 RepID=A0AC35G751_9BILA